MRLHDLPTPALILDRARCITNLGRMQGAVARHGLMLRPHLKTAKSADVARLVFGGHPGPITVSTLAEAEYFAARGFTDQTLAAGITPEKLTRAAALVGQGVALTLLTDDLETARAIGAHGVPFRALIEIDSGEHRGGIAPADSSLLPIAEAMGTKLAGVLTHGGHAYLSRTIEAIQVVAEQERRAVADAADRLRTSGYRCPVVSVGSTPTALYARHLDGVTEVRAGVYMFGDLFQAEIGSCTRDDVALTVLSSVIGRRPSENRLLLDAGALALSKDRSTRDTAHDAGFGVVWDLAGRGSYGECIIERAYQEHGVATSDRLLPFDQLPVGTKVRVAPNHACLTAAAYDRYYVTEGGDEVVAEYDRINGW